jgi:pimeloyl-ACP methyl ester carboxylesterase
MNLSPSTGPSLRGRVSPRWRRSRDLARRLNVGRSVAVCFALVIAAAVATVGPALAGVVVPAAAGSPALSSLRIDGAQIAYRDINPRAKGTPLLLIIGYGSTMAEWDPQLISGLARGRRVIMFDNRGAGESTGSVRHLSVRLMADDAAGLISELRLGRTDVLGWSMGGFIAQELALDHPGMVRRLILASTDAGSSHAKPGKPGVIRTLTNPATSVTELLPVLFPPGQAAAAGTWLTAIASQPGLTSQDFVVTAMTKAAQTNATQRLWLRPHEGTYARLSAIRASTLVAYGTQDVIVPASNAQILLKLIPHAKALRVSNAGHAFLFQDPTRIAKAFTAFLSADS